MSYSKLREGNYRAVLIIDESAGLEIPFNFELKYKGKHPQIIIKNAEERIRVDEINIKGDSVNFKMPTFDTEFKCIKTKEGLSGVWINHYRGNKNQIPFRATYGEYNRFLFVPGKSNPIFEGNWEITFSPGTKDSTKAVGVFNHIEQTDYLRGTFLTETGDYRFLDGMRNGNKLFLSTFDGSHAYLFTAELKDEQLHGKFYSGLHWVEDWTGLRNSNFALRDAEEITYLKNKSDKISFTFPDLENKPVSLNDEKFRNKPVIVQLMGSWCPNCLDESVYFSELYKKYGSQGLEIIALAFEKTADSIRSVKQVSRMKQRIEADYTFLITSKTGKVKATEVFPQLNEVSAFPTALFLNKKHEVVKIHTGFSGPATGKAYDEFKERTDNLIKQLLKE